MRRALAATVLVTAWFGVPASPVTAGPIDVVVSTTPGQLFAPATVVVPEGGTLRLLQLDPTARHDVVSRHVRSGRPIFGNDRTLAFGESALVRGVERLRPASYPFTCSIHAQMSGSLVVQG